MKRNSMSNNHIFQTTALWTALITPLDNNGEVHTDDLVGLVHEQEQAGNGLVILGSTGEGLNLSLKSKQRIIEIVSDCKPTVPVIAGVGGHDIEATLSWIEFLETQSIDGYLMVTPIYSKPGAVGQYEWFKTLLDSVTKPAMLYNVPGRTAVGLSVEAVGRLSSHTNFGAIKESSANCDNLRSYIQAGKVPVYCGDDPMLSEYVSNGSCGLVSVASNAWPAETAAYVSLALDGTLTMMDINLWKHATMALFKASNPIPVKALMADQNRISTPTVKTPLSSSDYTHVSELVEFSKQIRVWYENCRYFGRIQTNNNPLQNAS